MIDEELKTEKQFDSGRGKSKKEAQEEHHREEGDRKHKARHGEVILKLQRLVDVNEKKLVESQRSREIMTIRSAFLELADYEDARKQL
jgi:hypothetical protein